MFVTPLYAGLLTLWFVVLSIRVMNLRRDVPFGEAATARLLVSFVPRLTSPSTCRSRCC